MKPISLDKLVAETADLPVLPAITGRIVDCLADPGTADTQFAALLEKDAELTGRVLKAVNSKYVGFNRDITSVKQALMTLGYDTVRNIIFSLSFLDAKGKNESPMNLREFVDNSFIAAMAAKLIIRHFSPRLEKTAFLTGLMMNIGQLALAKHYPQEYIRLVQETQASDNGLRELELNTFLWDHASVGAKLAKHWRCEDVIIQSIQYHHTPDPPVDSTGRDTILISSLYVAHLMVEVFSSQAKKESLELCIDEAKRKLDFSEDSVHEILESIGVEGKEIAEIFDFKPGISTSYAKVLHAINIQLDEIKLSYEEMLRELRKAKAEAETLAHRLKIANKELRERAEIDGLTQIFNHRYFQEHLAVEFVRSVRYKTPLAVALLDVDFFKKVNDTYGHTAGDLVLQEIAAMLKKHTRMSDIVARYGGEEFVMIMPETTKDNAFIVAEKIRNIVENHPFKVDGTSIQVTISGGIAALESKSKYSVAEELVKSADAKLYRAKNSGRNRIIK